MAPCNGTTSAPPKLAITLLSPHHSTLQRHPAMAPRPLPPKLAVTLTIAWHPAVAPRPLHPAMAPWCHVQSAKVVRRPPPLLEVRTPIAIAIWGKIDKCTLAYFYIRFKNLSRDDRWTMDWKLRRKGLHRTQRRAKGRSHTSHELWFILALHLCRWAFDHRVMATAAIILSSVSKCKSIKIYQRLVIVSHLHQTHTHINILTIHVCIPLKWKMQVLDRKALYHADSCHPLFMRTC